MAINMNYAPLIGSLVFVTPKTFPETVQCPHGYRAVWRPPLSPPAGVAPFSGVFQRLACRRSRFQFRPGRPVNRLPRASGRRVVLAARCLPA